MTLAAAVGCVVGVERSSLTSTAHEQPGSNCRYGGRVMKSGVDVNGDGQLQDTEVTSTEYDCWTPVSLTRLDQEKPGSNCRYGGRVERTGLDENGDEQLQDTEVTRTEYDCDDFPSGWAAFASDVWSGWVPQNFWAQASRVALIRARSSGTRFKVTVSDNLGIGLGVNFGADSNPDPDAVYGAYEVRMNGASFNCLARRAAHYSAGRSDIYAPFATVCVTRELEPGIYLFDAWIQAAVGNTAAGNWQGQALLLVEELQTGNSSAQYGPWSVGQPQHSFETADVSYQAVPERAVSYQKKGGAETLLKVTLADTLGVGIDGGTAFAAVRMARNGGPIEDTDCVLYQYEAKNMSADLRDPFVATCVLPELPPDSYSFSVWLRSGSAEGGRAVLGSNRSYPLVLVEELPAAGISFAKASAMSDLVSGDAGIWQRATSSGNEYLSVAHHASSTTTNVRITYSDTFRGATCNGHAGLVAVRDDGHETSCRTGVNSYSEHMEAQRLQRPRPINLTCVLPVTPNSDHTFSIWSQVWHESGVTPDMACTNRLGQNRGQRLLLVEDLP
jgi:hypothetical protein